jgi:hypothetical protein
MPSGSFVSGPLRTVALAAIVMSFAFPIAAASVSGTVFDDLNGNGTINAGEPGLAGVTVNLDANAVR